VAVPVSAEAAVEPLVHYALFYIDEKDYLAKVLPFLAEGLAVGEPALVMAPGHALDLLRSGLGASPPRSGSSIYPTSCAIRPG
jgi:MEDS: MEthanogen/methylotroph, DcmR Sensory domain